MLVGWTFMRTLTPVLMKHSGSPQLLSTAKVLKFHGSESSLYGLFAPGNESAEERKGQIPMQTRSVLW